MDKLAADSPLSLPAAGEVQLWLLQEPAALAAVQSMQYEAWLSEDERERWQRYRHAADKDRFLLTRALQRRILSRYCHGKPADLRFGNDEHGKPFLFDGNQPHANLRFNLSHTRGLCALAVSNSITVGVDVESAERKVEMLPLAERFFAREEVAYLQALPLADLHAAFFRLWTLKEAYVKARGIGIKMGLDSFAIDASKESPQLLHADNALAGQWSFFAKTIGEHFHLAAALPLPDATFSLNFLQ